VNIFKEIKDKSFTYVSLFSGIGGFEQALNKLGGACVMASEIDKFANQAYEVLYGNKTVGDITKVVAEDVPDHDLLCGGFRVSRSVSRASG
jgi:DNA (cytosine-5)-methyltransferase 1